LYLDRLDKDSSIKVVILRSPNNSLEKDSFLKAFNSWSKAKVYTNVVMKVCRALDQIMLKTIDSKKIFISAQSGKMIFPFFSLSLACDYRIAADNLVVQNPEPMLGLIPKGGGAFFLPRILGTSGAFDLLLSGKNLSAYELLRLKLVDKVVEFNKLRHTAIEKSRDFVSKPIASLSGIKRLLNYSAKNLNNYLEFENEQLLRNLAVLRPDANGA